ncbi:MAG: hypothetical protein IJ157_03900 [Clostridia bacterium]|nr:hypothetical protein [Clostridia bacterium]
MELLKLLDHPSREYTPIPFWFLNGDLDHAEIRRQLRDFLSHGVSGVVLHPRIGLREDIGYLSEAFFDYLRTAVETAASLDMKIVFYDEGMYPSGSACGQVVRDHPELASRGIALVKTPAAGDTVLCETGGMYLTERFSGGTIRGIHFGEDDGEPYAPPSADILNPQAVERFIQLTHEAYYRHFSGYFGNTVIGFFTDEPSILGRNTQDMFPWTRGFADLFVAAGGHLQGLAALFEGKENADTALYHRLILERESRVYYAALSSWCSAHNIALMGHPHQSDDIEVQRFFGVPGQDLVFRWVSPEQGNAPTLDSTMAKCSADMARLLGRKRNSNECFGACNRNGNPWYFTGEDMKWYIDWLAVRGVNLFIPHAFYYSLAGQRSAERPPDVGPGSIWWPHYRLWADYMTRLSCLMAESSFSAPIALLCRNRDLRPDLAAPLFEAHKSFEYLPESMWADCREAEGKLRLGSRVYSAVLGPETQFAAMPHSADAVDADCLCRPPQPDLRVAPLTYRGERCWLLVNEGKNDIETELTLPWNGKIGQYDLWRGAPSRIDVRETEGGVCLALSLPSHGSLLLFACGEEDWQALPAPERLPEMHADFKLKAEAPDQLTKTYEAVLPPCGGDFTLCVRAEEMAELYVNGVFRGVSFWQPHRFVVRRKWTNGQAASLKLVITGSPANRYGDPVPYGIEES